MYHFVVLLCLTIIFILVLYNYYRALVECTKILKYNVFYVFYLPMAIFDNENERLHVLSVALAIAAYTFIFLM